MAKKVSLPSSSAPTTVPEGAPAEQGGVRRTPVGARDPFVGAAMAQDSAVFPPVPHTNDINAQDANDGSQDGDQPSFEMPAFANGQDVRHRG